MYRPYAAILRDSLRSAMASRVLYVVLIIIVLILILIFPLHVDETLDYKIRNQQMRRSDRLITRLVEAGENKKDDDVIYFVWSRFDAELQRKLQDLVKENAAQPSSEDANEKEKTSSGDSMISQEEGIERSQKDQQKGLRRQGATRSIVDQLNKMINDREFGDSPIWKNQRLNSEAKQLLETGVSNLSSVQSKRLNRLLIDSALGFYIQDPAASALSLQYLTFQEFFSANLNHAQFRQLILSQLPGIFDKFVMSIGLFIAILVTASVIPEMLEAGSLNLLLSKPVPRWGLLLTKYMGGCVFVLLCATLFFVGIWFWMGIQLGIWEPTILVSIPIYVLVFAMYYSVSVLAGLWFRSAILAIVLSVLFWAVCFTMGFAFYRMDSIMYNRGPSEIVSHDNELLFSNTMQNHHVWNESTKTWQQTLKKPSVDGFDPDQFGIAFASSFAPLDFEFGNTPGPSFDPSSQRFVAGYASINQGPNVSSYAMFSADKKSGWSTEEQGTFPSGTILVTYDTILGFLAINDEGRVFQWKEAKLDHDDGDQEKTEMNQVDDKKNANAKSNSSIAEKLSNGLGLSKSSPKKSSFKSIGPRNPLNVANRTAIGFNHSNREIAVYGDDQFTILKLNDDEKYEVKIEKDIDLTSNQNMNAFVIYEGTTLVVALGNGQFYQLNPSDLSVVNNWLPVKKVPLKMVAGSPDGRWFGGVYRNGQSWIYDAQSKEVCSATVAGEGDLLSIGFDNKSQMWSGSRLGVLTLHDLENDSNVRVVNPEPSTFATIYRFGIRPLYRIFPKPGEFYQLITHLSPSADTNENPDVDLTRMEYSGNPWAPLYSGLAFTVAMLMISCFIFQRADY